MVNTVYDGERNAAQHGSAQWHQIILSGSRPASARRPSRLHSLLTAVEPNGFAGLVDQCTRPVAHPANRLPLPLLQEIRLLAFSARLQSVAEAGLDLGTPLMQAIARSPAVASRYIGIYSGATPVGEFFNPFQLAWLMIEDGLRYQLPHL